MSSRDRDSLRYVALTLLAFALLAFLVSPAPAQEPDDPTVEELVLALEISEGARAQAERLAAKRLGIIGKRERTIGRQRQIIRRGYTYEPAHYLEQSFLCIHSHEGKWSDPNPPHWGGLQMDLDFQRTYGPEFLRAFGTADRWPRSVQLAVAIKAWFTRGFGPWPNTRKPCGL